MRVLLLAAVAAVLLLGGVWLYCRTRRLTASLAMVSCGGYAMWIVVVLVVAGGDLRAVLLWGSACALALFGGMMASAIAGEGGNTVDSLIALVAVTVSVGATVAVEPLLWGWKAFPMGFLAVPLVLRGCQVLRIRATRRRCRQSAAQLPSHSHAA